MDSFEVMRYKLVPNTDTNYVMMPHLSSLQMSKFVPIERPALGMDVIDLISQLISHTYK